MKFIRPDLIEEQSEEVLQRCARKHDTDLGINWNVIRVHADHVFPEPYGEEQPVVTSVRRLERQSIAVLRRRIESVLLKP